MEYIVPLVLIFIFTGAIISICTPATKVSYKVKTNDRSRVIIETELELLRVEMIETQNTITLLEHQKSIRRYANFPRRYYDLKRKVEYLPTKIHLLEDELKKAPKQFLDYVDPKDKYFLANKLSSLKSSLIHSEESLKDMRMYYDGTGTPKEWYEVMENKCMIEAKLKAVESKIEELAAIESRQNKYLFNTETYKTDNSSEAVDDLPF